MELAKAGLVGLGIAVLSVAGALSADRGANEDMTGQPQYRHCVSYTLKRLDGSNSAAPLGGASKAEAWCACLVRHIPSDFDGGLVEWAKSPRGYDIDRRCRAEVDWPE